MSRRKLSDVLREEIVMEETATETMAEAPETTEAAAAESEPTSSNRRLTKADLEAKVQQLEALAIANQATFDSEKAVLEAKIASQAEQITELRRYLDQANILKVDLDAAQAELAKLKTAKPAPPPAKATPTPSPAKPTTLPSTLQRPVGPSQPDSFNKNIHLF